MDDPVLLAPNVDLDTVVAVGAEVVEESLSAGTDPNVETEEPKLNLSSELAGFRIGAEKRKQSA